MFVVQKPFFLLLSLVVICSRGFVASPSCPRHQQQVCIKHALRITKESEQQQEVWYDATVLSTKDACTSGKSLLWRIQVPLKLAHDYMIPGQFLQLKKDDKKPLFLAMCSPPSNEHIFEFLVKTTPNIPWLPSINSGITVQLSNIMGNGFHLDEIQRDDNVIMCVAGSGIAPIKACIDSGNVKSGRLYYGEWTANDLCFSGRFGDNNIEVIPCLSRDEDSRYKSGYVQDVLKQDGLPSSCVAILCGMPEMEESVKAILLEAGVSENNIRTNLQ